MKRKKLLTKQNKLITIKDEIDGTVIVNNKSLIKNKDFFLTNEGIELSKDSIEKINDTKVKSYSFFYSRSITRS